MLLTCALFAGCTSPSYQSVELATIPPSEHPIKNQASSSLEHQLRKHYALWQDTPYLYGGNDQAGIDCSGLIQTTFNTILDIQLPRTTKEQVLEGNAVAQHQLKTGDLVFFKTDDKERHAGIYLSNNEFLHSSSSTGVTISSLDNPYWQNHYWQTRRIID